jgi:hypothetical protein
VSSRGRMSREGRPQVTSPSGRAALSSLAGSANETGTNLAPIWAHLPRGTPRPVNTKDPPCPGGCRVIRGRACQCRPAGPIGPVVVALHQIPHCTRSRTALRHPACPGWTTSPPDKGCKEGRVMSATGPQRRSRPGSQTHKRRSGGFNPGVKPPLLRLRVPHLSIKDKEAAPPGRRQHAGLASPREVVGPGRRRPTAMRAGDRVEQRATSGGRTPRPPDNGERHTRSRTYDVPHYFDLGDERRPGAVRDVDQPPKARPDTLIGGRD